MILFFVLFEKFIDEIESQIEKNSKLFKIDYIEVEVNNKLYQKFS